MSLTYELDASIEIFRRWCSLQFLDERRVLLHIKRLKERDDELNSVVFRSCKNDAVDYIFKDCIYASRTERKQVDPFLLNFYSGDQVTCSKEIILRPLSDEEFECRGKPLHPELWNELLRPKIITCFGCFVDHSSEIEHLGAGGCTLGR